MSNTSNTSSRTRQVAVPAAGRYRLDPALSSVSFRTRHMFGLAGVKGTIPVVGGDIVVDPAVPEADVTVTLNVAAFSTGHKKRDGDVAKPKFLNVGQYPEMTFRAYKTGALQRSGSSWTLDGELTVRGVTKPVTLSIDSVESTGLGFRATASTRIDRYAFGLTAAKGMAARYLTVELVAVAESL
jgi:polyisoprenoid-binding protein YceI